MKFDAIIVAGGRGSRLGGRDKPLLAHGGSTLLEHALRASSTANRIAVVGPTELNPVISDYAAGASAGQILTLTREYPAFAGPAAAVAAGLRSLGDGTDGDIPVPVERAPLTLILAADLLDPGPVVEGIVAHAGEQAAAGSVQPTPETEGIEAEGLGDADYGRAWVPVDTDGRLQPLSCVVETEALLQAVESATSHGQGLANSSMMRLLAKVQIVRVSLDGVNYTDVDTWEDADRAGISRPPDHDRGR
ncbi:NTP transferase domain-containing protein [Arthrobacter rhombi]|uniref:NTP transferase domain-containing protein n=1 Tax=Arthrobacter rhombi TaxID=71253 RepID=UPI003FD0B652